MERDISPDESVYDFVDFEVARNRLRYVIPAAFLMFGGLLASSLRENWGSTYICPAVLGSAWWIPVMQGVCVALDFALIVMAAELSRKENRTYDEKERPLPVLLGLILLVCIHGASQNLDFQRTNKLFYIGGSLILDGSWACGVYSRLRPTGMDVVIGTFFQAKCYRTYITPGCFEPLGYPNCMGFQFLL